MKVAFYAPLKPLDHPNPSGDRLLARSLAAALARSGHEVAIASELRSFEGNGNASRQRELRQLGEKAATALIDAWQGSRRPDVWLTYHVYQKAPDWIGPRVCDGLGIPYIIAEASLSPKQAHGPWQEGHRQTIHCLERADAVIVLNRRDLVCTRPHLPDHAHIVEIRPFLDLDHWLSVEPAPRRAHDPVRLITVAMMRHGDKLRSWMLLAEWLAAVATDRWTLDAVGDGAAREPVIERLRAVGGERVRFHGRLQGGALLSALDRCDVFIWPAVNEAFGMALLEAQARGLAVVAGRDGGVAEVVCHGLGGFLASTTSPADGGAVLDHLIHRPAVIERMGDCARRRVRRYHGLDRAARQLDLLLTGLCERSS